MQVDGTSPPTTVVVMGVSGSGKTTVAERLAERLDWEFAEGDEFHPRANVEKMAAGHPLDDADRWPWLRTIGGWIDQVEGRTGHYMPASLLESQLATLEPLRPDEAGAEISGAGSPDAVVDDLLTALGRDRAYRPSTDSPEAAS